MFEGTTNITSPLYRMGDIQSALEKAFEPVKLNRKVFIEPLSIKPGFFTGELKGKPFKVSVNENYLMVSIMEDTNKHVEGFSNFFGTLPFVKYKTKDSDFATTYEWTRLEINNELKNIRDNDRFYDIKEVAAGIMALRTGAIKPISDGPQFDQSKFPGGRGTMFDGTKGVTDLPYRDEAYYWVDVQSALEKAFDTVKLNQKPSVHLGSIGWVPKDPGFFAGTLDNKAFSVSVHKNQMTVSLMEDSPKYIEGFSNFFGILPFVKYKAGESAFAIIYEWTRQEVQKNLIDIMNDDRFYGAKGITAGEEALLSGTIKPIPDEQLLNLNTWDGAIIRSDDAEDLIKHIENYRKLSLGDATLDAIDEPTKKRARHIAELATAALHRKGFTDADIAKFRETRELKQSGIGGGLILGLPKNTRLPKFDEIKE